MAISYNDWKKQYEALDSAWKQKYADLAKNSALWQQYMNQYNSEKNTPTIWWTPIWNVGWVKTYQVAKNDTPTIWWQTIQTKTPTTNNPTIWWKPLLNNGTRPVWDSILGNSNIREVDTIQNWTRPIWESVLWGSNVKEVNFNNTKSSWPKSIFDKPETPVKDFKILGINPYWTQTAQNGKTTTKQPSVSTPKKTGYTTPKQVEWDYQDNSQARMDQIADNLNKYTQTNPELFKDYDTFYNFFIAWKGRSEDQKRFLDQYYANYKQNEKYGNMTPEELGTGMANWTVPEDYINTVNATDPNKAAAIKDSLKDAQDWIANEWYLSELAGLSGFHAWNAKEMLYRDVNKDWLDDRLYHEPTEEERKLVDENSELEAERLKLSNSMKDLQSDLTDQYPDADLSTIMLLTSDRWTKIQKALDTLNVTQTKLQWTIKYLQTERTTMDKAWLNTISELQKNYQLYMQYSPEWIKELATAQYEATHPTLDKAENWTDTDKAMALESVLQWYYDKYWDIIQRPMNQVVQDVIREAKASGKSLVDALNDNFITPLRAKPQFDTISAWGSANGSWTLEAIKDSEWNIIGYVKIDKNTWNIEWVSWYIGWLSWDWDWWYQEWNNWQFTNYTPISQKEMVQWLKDFMNGFVDKNWYLTGTWGQCWHFVNDYLEKIWIGRLYTDPIDKKKAITNTNTPAIWAVAVMDSKTSPQYWHVAIVGKVNSDWTVTLLESNWGWDEKIHIRENVDPSKIYWYFNPSIAPSEVANQYWYWENPMSNQITQLYSSKDINAEQKKDLKFADQAYWIMYDLASSWDIDYLLKSNSGQKMLANLKNSKFIENDSDATGTQVMDALKNWVTDQRNLRTVNRLINLIELKLRKTSWAAIAASEWNTNFSQLLPWVWESYDTAKDKYTSFEKDYLMAYFNSVWGWKKWYKYEALFSPNSPYYKVYNPSKTSLTSSQSNKGTWSLWGVNNTQINDYDDLYYYMWI